MKTLLLRMTASGLLTGALICLFSFSGGPGDGGGGGNGGGGNGEQDCPPGYQWEDGIGECVPMKWVIKPCYKVFGQSSEEADFFAICHKETEEGIVMECGGVTNKSPLPFAREFQCITLYEGAL